MIPFWKKTGKHSKPQSAQKRRQKAKPAVPRTAQQSIPMQRMFEDGTCRVKPNYYTRTIQYQDINYQLAQQEDKTAIFEEWCSFLNFFDSSIKFELSFVNMATDSTEFEKSMGKLSCKISQFCNVGNDVVMNVKFLGYGLFPYINGNGIASLFSRTRNQCILYIGKANHYIVSPPDTFVLFWSSHSIILLHFIVAKQLPISRRRSAANTFMWSQIAKI